MTEEASLAPRVAAPATRVVRHLPGVLTAAFLFVISVYFLLPLYWLVVAATKDTGDLLTTSGLWFSERLALGENLGELFSHDGGIFGRWLANSFTYALGGALGSTLLAALAGYALAKYRFFGRDLAFSAVLGATLVPSTVLVLPLYLLASRFGITNTVWAVLLPSMVSPFGVYLARVYAATAVPDELLDAARMDGCNEYRTFAQIVAPILAPALVTIFLFQFVSIWNNFFLPLVMLSKPELFPVTVGLQLWNVNVAGSGQRPLVHLIISGSLVSVVPLMLGFLLLQRFWTGGLAVGSVKG